MEEEDLEMWKKKNIGSHFYQLVYAGSNYQTQWSDENSWVENEAIQELVVSNDLNLL